MNKPPAFQFYAADFVTDTSAMTAEQLGAYMRLLCYAWINGEVPADQRAMAQITGIQPARFRSAVWPMVERCWESDGNGSLLNPRLEIERKKQVEWRRKSAKGGRAKRKADGIHP